MYSWLTQADPSLAYTENTHLTRTKLDPLHIPQSCYWPQLLLQDHSMFLQHLSISHLLFAALFSQLDCFLTWIGQIIEMHSNLKHFSNLHSRKTNGNITIHIVDDRAPTCSIRSNRFRLSLKHPSEVDPMMPNKFKFTNFRN